MVGEPFRITLAFLLETRASEYGCKFPVPKQLVDQLLDRATRDVIVIQRAWRKRALRISKDERNEISRDIGN